MEIHNLHFGDIVVHNKRLAEVIIKEGVTMDEAMVEEYHAFLLENLQAPFKILVNKKYSYTYTGAAQMNIATLKEIEAMAIVVYTKPAEIATKTLQILPGHEDWNLKIFYNYEEAMSWLKEL